MNTLEINNSEYSHKDALESRLLLAVGEANWDKQYITAKGKICTRWSLCRWVAKLTSSCTPHAKTLMQKIHDINIEKSSEAIQNAINQIPSHIRKFEEAQKIIEKAVTNFNDLVTRINKTKKEKEKLSETVKIMLPKIDSQPPIPIIEKPKPHVTFSSDTVFKDKQSDEENEKTDFFSLNLSSSIFPQAKNSKVSIFEDNSDETESTELVEELEKIQQNYQARIDVSQNETLTNKVEEEKTPIIEPLPPQNQNIEEPEEKAKKTRRLLEKVRD